MESARTARTDRCARARRAAGNSGIPRPCWTSRASGSNRSNGSSGSSRRRGGDRHRQRCKEVGPALFLPLDPSLFNFPGSGFNPASLSSSFFGPLSHWAALRKIGGIWFELPVQPTGFVSTGVELISRAQTAQELRTSGRRPRMISASTLPSWQRHQNMIRQALQPALHTTQHREHYSRVPIWVRTIQLRLSRQMAQRIAFHQPRPTFVQETKPNRSLGQQQRSTYRPWASPRLSA
jgi:hypothetical protein